MATRYPGALDRDPNEIPDNIADSDTLDSPNHATIHNNVNGAVLQIEEKLGIGDTVASAGAVLHGTAAGESAWTSDPSIVGSLSVAKDSADAVINLTAHHDTEATAAELTLRKSDGSKASPALVDDDAVLGKVMFQGYDGNSYANGAVIQAQVDGTPADGDMPTELIFQVTPDGGSETPATAMTIKPDGKVGIGDITPLHTLEVHSDDDLTSFTGTAKGAVKISNSQYDANDFTALDFGYSGSDNPIGRIATKITGSGSEMYLGTSGDYAQGIDATGLKINKDGIVSPVDGALQSWTPTYGNITVGNGTVVAKYQQFGDVVHWMFQLTFGSTTSFSGSIYISAPVTPDSSISFPPSGNAWLVDAGSYIYNGHTITSGGSIFFYAEDELGTYTRSVNVNATVPHTWATSDRIHAAGWYVV
tara:strand:- start:347 stop:1603 length:1257 start_codon:yes stop_codon:yes gene_type:complete